MASDELPNEWESVPRSPEGRPQITVNPPPPPTDQLGDGPWPLDVALSRPPQYKQPQPEQTLSRSPDQMIGDTVRGAAEGYVDHLKELFNPFVSDTTQEDYRNQPIPPAATRDLKIPENQKDPISFGVPIAAEVAGTFAGKPGAGLLWEPIAKAVGTGAAGMAARNAARQAATHAPGIGHNMPPPGPLPGGPPHGAPPVPPAAPPAGPRQIIHGYDNSEPLTFDRIYTRTIDDLNPLKILEKGLSQHGALGPDEQFYQLGRLTRGSFGRSHQALNNSTFDFRTLANNGPGLKQVLAPVAKDLKAFEEYAVAARDVELIQRGFQTGETLASAMAKVNAAPPVYRQALQHLHAYQDRVLQYLRDSGVLSGQAYQDIKALNQSYVPFHRAMDNADMFTSNKNIKSWNPIKRMQGSERDILSPIETIIRNTHMFMDLAEKNRALTALVLAGERRPLSGLVKRAPPQTHPVQVTKGEIQNFLQGSGIQVPPGFAGAPDHFTIFRPNAFRPAPDEISVFVNGKRRNYKVDPEVANAVNGLGHQEVDIITRFLSIPARTLRAGAVLGPEFLVKNPARDQLVAMVFSKNGYLPVIDYIRGLGHMVGNSQSYQMWLKSGGANSSLVSLDRRYIAEEINNLTKSGVLNKIKDVINPKNILQNLGKVSEYGEQPTRIAEFIKAQNRGKGVHQSGLESREVSVDFGRHGSSKALEHISRTSSFFNPQAQGIDRLARAFKENPAATSFKIAAGIVLPTLAIYAYNRQDPRMKSIPRWERDIYWHIPTDDWQPYKPMNPNEASDELASIPDDFKKEVNGQTYVNYGTIYRAPKPFEIGTTFGSSLERVLDAYFAKDPEAFKDFAKTMRSSWLPNPIPQWMQPGIETAANFNFFRDRQIVPKRLESPAHRQYEYGPFTSETAKYIGSAIANIMPESRAASPMMIENAILGWSGTLGRYGLMIADKAISMASGKKKVTPAWGEADIPLWKAVVSRMPRTDAAEITDFYDNYEKTRTNRALVKRLNDEGAPFKEEESQSEKEQRTAPAKKVQSESVVTKMEKAGLAVSRQLAMIRKVYEAPNMTAEDKKRMIELLTLGASQIARQANQGYYEAEKKLGGGNGLETSP